MKNNILALLWVLKKLPPCELSFPGLYGNKPNCAISSGFAVTYYTNVGLGLAGWLSPGLRPGEAPHYLGVSI